MWRSLLDIGLTTISSVWNTPSTSIPKVCLPTWVTTMKPLSVVASPAVELSSALSRTSGSSLLRSRSTAASLMRSMRARSCARTRTSSSTASCGMAKRRRRPRTMSAEMMASVSGILMVKWCRGPASEYTSIVPPIWSMLARTTSMPTPRPDTLVIFSAVEKPAEKMKFWICASVILLDLGARRPSPLAMALALMRSMIEAAAVIGDLDDDVAALVAGGQADGAALGLAGARAARPASRGRGRRSCGPCGSADP